MSCRIKTKLKKAIRHFNDENDPAGWKKGMILLHEILDKVEKAKL